MDNSKYERKLVFRRFFKDMLDDDIYGFDLSTLLSYESITEKDVPKIISIMAREAFKEARRSYRRHKRNDDAVFYQVNDVVRMPSDFLTLSTELLVMYDVVTHENLELMLLSYGRLEKYIEKLNRKDIAKNEIYILKDFITEDNNSSIPLVDPERNYDTERILCGLKRYAALNENKEFLENLIKANIDLFTYHFDSLKGCFLPEIQKYITFSNEYFKENLDRFFVYYLQTFLKRYKNSKDIVGDLFEKLIPHSLQRIAKILSGNDLYQAPKCDDASELVLKYYIG